MKAAGVLVALAVALALQTTLAGLTIGGATAVNLVLVAVIYVALAFGPVAGLLAGSAGGLVQDALAGGIVGVGGFSKTLVGFFVGVLGAQFIVSQSLPRLVMFVGGDDRARALLPGALRAGRVARVPDAVVGGADAGAWSTASIGILAFQLVEAGPGWCSGGARRARGATLSRTATSVAHDVHVYILVAARPTTAGRPDAPAVRCCRYLVARRCSRRWRSGSGSSRSPQHQKFEEMAENNHMPPAAAAGAARRAVRPQRQGARREPNTFNIALVREQTRQHRRDAAHARGGDRRRRSADARDGQPPPPRAELPADRRSSRTPRTEQVIAVRRASCELPGIIYQEVPARRYPASDMAAHLFGYVSEVERGAAARAGVRRRRGGRDGRAGRRRAGLQQAADGQGRRPTVVVNSRRPRDGRASSKQDPSKGSASS